MAEISSVSQTSPYFIATQEAAKQQAKQRKLQVKAERLQRKSFSSALRKSQEEQSLASEGLPPDIAGMDEEAAVIFLKDAVDIAGDELKSDQTLAALQNYRMKVGQLMKYLVRNNFEVLEHKRYGRNRKTGKAADSYVQIKLINEKLDRLTSDMLYNHAKNLDLLSRVEEINGLIIDVLAA